MPDTTDVPPGGAPALDAPPLDAPPGRWRRLGWFVLLWLCGVLAVGTVGLLIRTALRP